MNSEKCKKWLENPTINPETNRKIKVNGPTYKVYEKLCYTNADLCEKWLNNPTVNPSTNRKIKKDGVVAKSIN